ncbi:DUF5953 family protein [Cystobacter fuscus]|uniref:DUF5953 family protein n=1 Tax=Cystobacter fuscus TaxID=43 RepID=UPI0037BFB6EB
MGSVQIARVAGGRVSFQRVEFHAVGSRVRSSRSEDIAWIGIDVLPPRLISRAAIRSDLDNPAHLDALEWAYERFPELGGRSTPWARA